MEIKILGTGCSSCKALYATVERVAKELNINVVLTKEEDLEKIWVKFYKVDKARTREYGGSGIGLSIVKAIMDSFHQKCGVINHENGVEFWMELESNN